MNPLAKLRSQGISLFLVGESLKFKAQRGITTQEKESIRKNKEEIIRLLRAEDWISPHPCRCVDCSRRGGCTRPEKAQWGLLQRHDCEEYDGPFQEGAFSLWPKQEGAHGSL